MASKGKERHGKERYSYRYGKERKYMAFSSFFHSIISKMFLDISIEQFPHTPLSCFILLVLRNE